MESVEFRCSLTDFTTTSSKLNAALVFFSNQKKKEREREKKRENKNSPMREEQRQDEPIEIQLE